MKPEETIVKEIKRISGNFKEDIPTLPLKRCTKRGVEDFIAEEASSYRCEDVGTIHNSVAKKAVDADLRTERKELASETVSAEPSVERVFKKFPSKVSANLIQNLLTTQVNKWNFQTSNSHDLVTFYAKGEKPSMELFVNFREDGDRSYICLGHHFGYLDNLALGFLKAKLGKVYDVITEEADKKELIWETVDAHNSLSKFERIKQEDPDTWNTLKEEAITEFLSEDESLIEKIFKFFNMNAEGGSLVPLYRLMQEDILDDETISNYLLDNIKIDIRQVYA